MTESKEPAVEDLMALVHEAENAAGAMIVMAGGRGFYEAKARRDAARKQIEECAAALAAHPSKGGDADIVEQIAQQWDGCEYVDAIGGSHDIGDAIRRAGIRLAASPTPPTAPERGHVLAALDRLEGSDDDLAIVYRAIVRADGEARDARLHAAVRTHVVDLRRCADMLLAEFPALAPSAREFQKAADELDAAMAGGSK